MKVNANPMASFNRELPKPGPAARADRAESPAPAEKPKTAPPGLERALARLQAISETERSPGQSNAMNQISRNLARYAETQAMVPTSPTEVTEPPVPEADLAVVTNPTTEAATDTVPEPVQSEPLEEALPAVDNSAPDIAVTELDEGALMEALLEPLQEGTTTSE